MSSNAKRPVKVLVVDDHPLVRRGIAATLAPYGGIKIVGEIGDAREVLARARALQPDVILMDISMPHLDGLTVTRLLQHALPAIKVLILSIYEDPEYVRQAIQAGACGYVRKGASAAELVGAIETVQSGEFYFSAELVRLPLELAGGVAGNGGSRLTEREYEVLVQVAEGRSNKEIAGGLGVTVRTVEYHRGRLKRKLNIHSTASLARFAVANGWVPARTDAPALDGIAG